MRGHVLIAEQSNGLVHIGAVQNAYARLELLQSHGAAIQQRHIRRTPYALNIALGLKRQFATLALEPGGPWYVADFAAVVAALGDWDLKTGLRRGLAGITNGARVSVDGLGTGTVTGFAGCNRVQVSMDGFARGVLTTLAPANQVQVLG